MNEHTIIERAITAPRAAVVEHPIARQLHTLDAVRTFTQHHVWAVWGFMHLLNGLRHGFTRPVEAWLPPTSPMCARLINEIVLAEESDAAFGGLSHFTFYVEAMHELGADTGAVENAVHKVMMGHDPITAALEAGAPVGAVRFLAHDWTLAAGPLPELVAAFTYGRETLIPAMFGPILEWSEGDKLARYLTRHIEVDVEHGDHALDLVRYAVDGDPMRLWAMIRAARAALVARRSLWDDTLTAIMEKQ